MLLCALGYSEGSGTACRSVAVSAMLLSKEVLAWPFLLGGWTERGVPLESCCHPSEGHEVEDICFGPRGRHNEHSTTHILMRIFFATDLHGSDTCFRKFLAAKAFYSADVLILGGDYTGKALLPLVHGSHGYRAELFGRQHLLRSEAEMTAFEQRARQFGYYTLRVSSEELERLEYDHAYRQRREDELICERLEQWIAMAADRLPGDSKIYICPGNDDPPVTDALLESAPPFVWIERRFVELPEGYSLMGFGGSNPTPWNTPREYQDEEIATALSLMQHSEWSRTVCSIHVPPIDSGVDLAPELDSKLQVRTAPGEVALYPVGSPAVREFIEHKGPLLALCGHVHEAQGKSKIGPTLCLNPGSTYNQGVLSGVLVDLRAGTVQSTQFTSG